MQKRITDIVEYEHAIFGKLIIRKGMRKTIVNVYKFHGTNEPWRYQGSTRRLSFD